MAITMTPAQLQRLRELGGEMENEAFPDAETRDASFLKEADDLTRHNREGLRLRLAEDGRTSLTKAMDRLRGTLGGMGFFEVCTPHIISGEKLRRMGITEEHALNKQVFWIDRRSCLRPMLAPNLYAMMGQLGRSLPRPMRLYEIGSCFRKESRGESHLEEFTMLNLVECSPDSAPLERLKELAAAVMGGMELPYSLQETSSEVYGTTIDVEVDGLEVASGAVGPHPLDVKFGIKEPWVGLGFGVERLAMRQQGIEGIRRVGRGISYLNGYRIDI
jgi:phenylalanyl-tRNA synthetase alpha chain